MKRESPRQSRETTEDTGEEPVRSLKDGRQAPMRLGNPNGAAHLKSYGNTAAIAAVRSQATERATGLQTITDGLGLQSITQATAMAKALNARLVATHRGGQRTARSVLNALGRLAA